MLDILFPKHCAGCGREALYICKECELFLVEASSFGDLTSFWEYSGIVKELIHRIKFNGEYNIIRELINKKEFEIAKNTTITFVPMHIKKKKKRGFNQAEIIARELGRRTGLPVVKLLEKVKQTKDQTELAIEERLDNLNGSFAFCGKNISGNVLLVDDFSVTGATMQECSKSLSGAGIRNIHFFTLAKIA